ncbi:MAG: aminodeoxychorismate/anthranilate synthase component II [Proteobacteria bacterium]|nr:aminodeoxychorismate/anthranilate synthase component II [Pseudomonadota bacterium]
MKAASSMRIVIIDNYDSFAYNLYQQVGEILSVEATVFRNDRITVAQIAELAPTHLILSPGPGNPEQPPALGVCRHLIAELARIAQRSQAPRPIEPEARDRCGLTPRLPVLGVCLGHQGIGHVFGARIVRAPAPTHGKAGWIRHDGCGVFRGLPNPVRAMRYHSLTLDPESIPETLRVTAWSEDGLVMGVSHRELPLWGVQFHPESIGTPQGNAMLRNFLLPGAAGFLPSRGPAATSGVGEASPMLPDARTTTRSLR